MRPEESAIAADPHGFRYLAGSGQGTGGFWNFDIAHRPRGSQFAIHAFCPAKRLEERVSDLDITLEIGRRQPREWLWAGAPG